MTESGAHEQASRPQSSAAGSIIFAALMLVILGFFLYLGSRPGPTQVPNDTMAADLYEVHRQADSAKCIACHGDPGAARTNAGAKALPAAHPTRNDCLKCHMHKAELAR